MKKIIRNTKSGKELCDSCKKNTTCKDYKRKDYPLGCFIYEAKEGESKK